MSNHQPTSNQTPSKRRRNRRRKNKRRSAQEQEQANESAAPDPQVLAGFSLLADPATIAAGVEAEAPASEPKRERAHDAEIESLRSALHLRSQEIESVREKWTVPASESGDRDNSGDAEPPRRALLDAASARRLAADARQREQASRKALEDAQRAIEDPGEDVAAGVALEPGASGRSTSTQPSPAWPAPGWSQRPLSRQAAENTATGVAESPLPLSEGPAHSVARRALANATRTSPLEAPARNSNAAQITALERALSETRGENRELQATLAIARETTISQKRDLASLRERLKERESQLVELQANATAPSAVEEIPPEAHAALRRENEELERQISELERERDESTRALASLERSLRDQTAVAEARSEQLDVLQDRLEAQDRAIDAARREYTIERTRHTRTLEVLDQLRETLSQASFELGSPPRAGADANTMAPSVHVEFALAQTDEPAPIETPPRTDPPAVLIPASRTSASQAPDVSEAMEVKTREDDSRDRSRTPFDYWLDDQVRRHFGPMGIDRLTDLLAAPLARRDRYGSGPRSIVLIGRDAWSHARHLAEGLVETVADGFILYVLDEWGEPRRPTIGFDSPLRDFVQAETYPANPAALRALLDEIAPAAVVSLDFMTQHVDPTPWLDVLGDAASVRSSLLLIESTGLGPIAAPDELRAIGDRIWELMPERYTRQPGGDRSFGSWLEAFESRRIGAPNGLSKQLRNRFRLEMSAQFGFLAAAFLDSPIAANFDPSAARDRRFLAQVADLDDRKIEAGAAPALYQVALVDELAASE